MKVIERGRASLYVIEVSLSEAHVTVGLIHAVFVCASASDSVNVSIVVLLMLLVFDRIIRI